MDLLLRSIRLAALGAACLLSLPFAAHADEAAIRKALGARMAGLPKIDQIAKSPIKGLYEVRLGNDLFYSDEDGNYLIEGQIIDTQTRANVTQARIDKLLAIDFASLPLKDAVVWKQGTGERRMAVFADPNCGYCKRFERDLLKVKDVTVYTFLFPILGGDSPDKARDIWCSKNNGQTWRSWMIDGTAPPHGECDASAIERNTAFGRAHRINGTPGLLFEDGRRVPGAMPAEDVEKQLALAARKPDRGAGVPRFSANLTLLFAELPFLDRFEAAAEAGFDAVEFQFPYAHAAADIRLRLAAHRLTAVLHNLPAGDWAGGDRGIACDPSRQGEFRAGVAQAVTYARELGVPRLNCLAGIVPDGVTDAHATDTLVANLRHAAGVLAGHGLTLLTEPVNTHDVPGFLLSHTDAALAVLDRAAAPNLRLQYDVYHAQRMEGDIATTLARVMPRIGHIQIADNPGRHEPGTGELNWRFLFAELDRLGYAGHVGCEYIPAATTLDGLGWLRMLGGEPVT